MTLGPVAGTCAQDLKLGPVARTGGWRFVVRTCGHNLKLGPVAGVGGQNLISLPLAPTTQNGSPTQAAFDLRVLCINARRVPHVKPSRSVRCQSWWLIGCCLFQRRYFGGRLKRWQPQREGRALPHYRVVMSVWCRSTWTARTSPTSRRRVSSSSVPWRL